MLHLPDLATRPDRSATSGSPFYRDLRARLVSRIGWQHHEVNYRSDVTVSGIVFRPALLLFSVVYKGLGRLCGG